MILVEGLYVDGSLCSRRSQDDPGGGLYMVLYVLDGHKMILVGGL